MFHPKHQLTILISMKDMIDVDIILKKDAVQIDIEEKNPVTGQEVLIDIRIEVENIFNFFLMNNTTLKFLISKVYFSFNFNKMIFLSFHNSKVTFLEHPLPCPLRPLYKLIFLV